MSGKQKVAVVGGGIVGLATAYEILERNASTVEVHLFEKEKQVGLHQSGRNSGVLHCGLYYQPGSLKAKMAVEGIRKMTAFCQKYGIPHEICGKILVATNEQEKQTLRNLAKRGKANGLKGLKILSPQEIVKREPYIRGIEGLLVPEEGIVDYKAVMNKLVDLIQERGGHIQLENKFKEEGTINFNRYIYCCGLQADRMFKKSTGEKLQDRIIPFRGEYLKFKAKYGEMVKHLVYPVPNPKFPFLGVHFTRLINGEREVGPNAVLAWKREGYERGNFSLKDSIETFSHKGFAKFIGQNFTFALGEWKSSMSMGQFLTKAQKMMPELKLDMLEKGNAGVRAQMIRATGELDMDFNIKKFNSQMHVLNAPSPGATASLSIAEYILNQSGYN